MRSRLTHKVQIVSCVSLMRRKGFFLSVLLSGIIGVPADDVSDDGGDDAVVIHAEEEEVTAS